MFTHEASRLHSGFLIKVRLTCTLPVPVLYCDVATFLRKGVLNTLNAHMRALYKTQSIRLQAAQKRLLVNARASIVGDSLFGPYTLPPRLHSYKYLVFQQEDSGLLLEQLIDVHVRV